MGRRKTPWTGDTTNLANRARANSGTRTTMFMKTMHTAKPDFSQGAYLDHEPATALHRRSSPWKKCRRNALQRNIGMTAWEFRSDLLCGGGGLTEFRMG